MPASKSNRSPMAAMPQPDSLISQSGQVVQAADRLLQQARAAVRDQVANEGLDAAQASAHGLAWLATYVEGLRQLHAWAQRLSDSGTFERTEQLILAIGMSEYASQIAGGIPMSQGEIIRPTGLGIPTAAIRTFEDAVADTVRTGESPTVRAELASLIAADPTATTFGNTGLDETLGAMREEMFRFSRDEVSPHAHEWHLANAYIPMEVIEKLANLGVFGITLPEAWAVLVSARKRCVSSPRSFAAAISVSARLARAPRSPQS